MKMFHAILFLIFRIIALVAAPLALVYLINTNYPGLLGYKLEYAIYVVLLLALPGVILHFFADISEGKRKVIFESVSLTLFLVYTYLILGSGSTHLFYKNLDVMLYYPYLLYLILASIAIRYPTIFLRYYAEKAPSESMD